MYISPVVLREIREGDGEAAKIRLAVAGQLPRLILTPQCFVLAEALSRELRLPSKAGYDALHLATAAVHRMDYLLTWNCRHIANESLIPKIRSIIVSWRHDSPVICTPRQLLRR
jgi:hypothetical protein